MTCIGGFRLINGETKFVFGGVVQAMQRGAILLLDEIDLGTERHDVPSARA
jgi:MoxR-like ATPase